jgi:NAD(P)-dependent dehydrogenase (short-subunit alcohol dehydrogenase family)
MIALELDASSARSIVNDPRPLNSSDVVLITGGARGVTAAVAQVIAKRFQPTIVLMGRTNIEAPEPEWLRDCHAEPAIKRAIARTIAQPAAPKIIEEQFRQVIAKREALRNIDSMRRAGSRVIYYSADVADLDAVKSVVRALPMPVTCLIHGAGVLADKRIEELSDEQFAAVFATKVTGLETLLTALRESPLKHIALFSSSTGRYGRTGQAAYAAANEAINKIAQQQARTRPDCKVASINWGPWDGGMVTPALRSMFESEGVGVIPLDRGAEVLIGELTAEKSEVEVTVIARPMKRTPSAVVAPAASSLQLAFEQQISLRNHPILASHIFDGRHVLPFALHLEWLAQAAMHSNPGYAFHGLNDLRLLQGVVLEEKGSIPLKTFAGKPQRCEGEIIIPVELHGKRGANEVVHSRAEVVLVQRLPFAQLPSEIPPMSPYPHPIDDIYRRFLFHGPMLAGVERIDGISGRAISGVSRTAPAPSAWLLQPMRSAWISDPMVIDAAFQLMILWSFAEQGAGSLPCFIGKYRQYRRTFPAGSIGIGIRITHENGALARADVDFTDADGGLVARLLDYECVIDEKLNRAFRKNRILERVAAEGNGSR